jgi:tetrapyrrole methylase family protein/MazG family protein
MTDPRIAVVGLGPAGIARLGGEGRARVMDERRSVIVRTFDHPAAQDLAAIRPVTSCDDLYESSAEFDDVYRAIVERVLEAAAEGPVTYAVPGSAAVGERAVSMLLEAVGDRDSIEILAGESFIDLACAATGVDAIADGLQVLDGRNLPEPLTLHLPTFITQVDSRLVAADVAVSLGKLLPADTIVTVLDRLGDEDANVTAVALERLDAYAAGPRATVFVPAAEVGWHGLVTTNELLRTQCPWDSRQTHHTLVAHLVEEAYETVDAISGLPVEAPGGTPDYGAYAVLEEELGDLLLQVVFHSTLAREAGAFDIDEVAEGIRRKLVSRHPHVFGDVEAAEVSQVLANWEELKTKEKGRLSLMDDVPGALPGVARADKIQKRAATVGFDWTSVDPVFDKVAEELVELRAAGADREAVTSELGDVLFAVVNLARHLEVDPEIALTRANDKFIARFRTMESASAETGVSLRDLSAAQLDERWEAAKRSLG